MPIQTRTFILGSSEYEITAVKVKFTTIDTSECQTRNYREREPKQQKQTSGKR